MAILDIQHIESTPGVLGGKPRIAGRGISVANIAVLYERHGWSVERITDQLELDKAQIHAALAYYYDHKSEVDASIDEGDARKANRSSPA
jgi:uncharacterized protein (DUF433 family)